MVWRGHTMHSAWFGEFMGTMVLVLLGNGVNAGVTLRKSYAADGGWIVVTAGWALGVLCGVSGAQGFWSHYASLYPAIPLAGAGPARECYTGARAAAHCGAGRLEVEIRAYLGGWSAAGCCACRTAAARHASLVTTCGQLRWGRLN